MLTMRDTHTAFDTCHPAVPAAYFAGTILIAIFAMQPVCVGISLMGALAFSFAARGWRRTLEGLRWQLPMVALVAVANPLFSASGSTLVAQLGPMAIYQESIAYGACAGALLVAVVLWFEDAACVLTQDRRSWCRSSCRGLSPCAQPRLPPRQPLRRARATAACVWRTSS